MFNVALQGTKDPVFEALVAGYTFCFLTVSVFPSFNQSGFPDQGAAQRDKIGVAVVYDFFHDIRAAMAADEHNRDGDLIFQRFGVRLKVRFAGRGLNSPDGDVFLAFG